MTKTWALTSEAPTTTRRHPRHPTQHGKHPNPRGVRRGAGASAAEGGREAGQHVWGQRCVVKGPAAAAGPGPQPRAEDTRQGSRPRPADKPEEGPWMGSLASRRGLCLWLGRRRLRRHRGPRGQPPAPERGLPLHPSPFPTCASLLPLRPLFFVCHSTLICHQSEFCVFIICCAYVMEFYVHSS